MKYGSMPRTTMKIIIIAFAKAGEGISGSDRIFIELARNWFKRCFVEIFTSSEGVKLCKTQDLSDRSLEINSINNARFEEVFLINYLHKILKGLQLGLFLKLPATDNLPSTFIYSASEFWMDCIPSLLLKLRFPKIKWVATWYQTAPNPIKGFAEYGRENPYRMSAFIYWFMQLPVKPFIKKYADFVIVNNEDERKQFHKMDY
jgi:hypothetical protein